MAINSKSYTAGQFLFALDDSADETAWLKSVDGGGIKGAVIEENIGPDFLRMKHLGTVEVEPITVEVGLSGTKPILKWIQESFSRSGKAERFSRRNGSIIHADFNQEAKMEYWFQDALISEVSFPALDGSDQNASYLTVKIQPETFKNESKDNNKIRGFDKQRQKLWSPANYKLTIDGLDCRRVSRIDSFTLKQKIKPLYFGNHRFPELEPTGIEIPNITLTIAAPYADGFMKWHEDFVVKGGRDPDFQKTGVIEFLDPTMNVDPIFSIKLDNIGINFITVEKSDGDAEAIKRCKIELFVENMELDVNDDGLD